MTATVILATRSHNAYPMENCREEDTMRLWLKSKGKWMAAAIGDLPLKIMRTHRGKLELAGNDRGQIVARALSFEEHGRRRAVLIASPTASITLNGEPCLRAVVLSEGDEITIYNERLLFSAASTDEDFILETWAESRCCARCSTRFRKGDTVVQCPICTACYHAGPLSGNDEPRNCWSYDPNCTCCGRTRETDPLPVNGAERQ